MMPAANGDPLSPLPVAAFLVSIDTEMAWGVHDEGPDAVRGLGPSRALDEREIIGSLLGAFQRHRIPATWAVVGHLFLDSCRWTAGRTHHELVRPDYEWYDGDWLALDPASDIDTDPLWYGTDIVEMIKSALPEQEIGSHSFSHLIAGDPGCSVAAFASDLAACEAAASGRGVTLNSFVFARNSIGHVEVLAAHGYNSYRGHRPTAFAHRGPIAGMAARAIDRLSPRAGSAVFPERVGALWNLPATNFYGPWRRRRWLPFGSWVDRQIRRLEIAARTRSLYHLWFHPQDLLVDTDLALRGLEQILERAASLRDQGVLQTLTMGQLAASLDHGGIMR